MIDISECGTDCLEGVANLEKTGEVGYSKEVNTAQLSALLRLTKNLRRVYV